MIRVLVIDDFEDHLGQMAGIMAMYGHDVRGARTAAQAVKVCEDWPPHLVICDSLLEDTRAWNFAFQLLRKKSFSPGEAPGERPYMVAVTGYPDKRQKCLCEEVGFDEYVEKPIVLGRFLSWADKAAERMRS